MKQEAARAHAHWTAALNSNLPSSGEQTQVTKFRLVSVSFWCIPLYSTLFHFVHFSFSLNLSYFISFQCIPFYFLFFQSHSVLFQHLFHRIPSLQVSFHLIPIFFQVSFHLIPISGVFWSFLHLWVTCGCTWLVPYGQSKDLYFPKTVYTQGSPLCQWIISSGYCAELLLWWYALSFVHPRTRSQYAYTEHPFPTD